jgi:hypothetical protein
MVAAESKKTDEKLNMQRIWYITELFYSEKSSKHTLLNH